MRAKVELALNQDAATRPPVGGDRAQPWGGGDESRPVA
jgi:hypothetical protein